MYYRSYLTIFLVYKYQNRLIDGVPIPWIPSFDWHDIITSRDLNLFTCEDFKIWAIRGPSIGYHFIHGLLYETLGWTNTVSGTLSSKGEDNQQQRKYWNTKEMAWRGCKTVIHISGATTGAETAQLYVVKESEGRLRASATRRALYRAAAAKSFGILEHISNQLSIVKLQEELTKENKVVTPITLLPEIIFSKWTRKKSKQWIGKGINCLLIPMINFSMSRIG